MRKNFFKKKLASTLALAMVVTSMSMPSTASAASSTHVVKQGGKAAPTVLYVGTKGTDYGLSKLYSGNKYTWTISDSSIATINKRGVVSAKAPGKVTIKCTARNSKGKWLAAFTKKLTIRQRVDSVDISSDAFSLFIDETKDLNAVKVPAISTDSIRYYSDNTDVATVNAKNGVVTAVGVGEATITVYSKAAWNTAVTSKYNRTDSVKVTVMDGIQAVKQTTTNKVELTFGTDQSEKLTKSNLEVTDKDGVKQVVKDIDFSDGGKTATVEFYLDFTDGDTYKFAYDNTEKTITASVGDVASVVLKSKTVAYETDTDLDYLAYDKNGIDVSSTVDWESDVDFDYEDADADIDWDEEDDVYQIYVYDYPDNVDVEMTYSRYDEDAQDTVEYTSKAVIKSVEEITQTADNIKYTLTDDENNDAIDWDDDDLVTTISADSDGLHLFIDADDENGDEITETDFDSFTSTDDDILTVSYDKSDLEDNDETTLIDVYPVDEGTAYIRAERGNTTKLLKVVVGKEAEAKSIKVDTNNIRLYGAEKFINAPQYGVTTEVTVKDQYGEKMDLDIAYGDISQRSGSDESPIDWKTDGSKVTFYLDKEVTKDNDGSYTYKIEAEDKTVNVSIRVIDVDDSIVTDIELASNDGDNELDVAFDLNDKDNNTVADKDKSINFVVYGLNDSGDRVDVLEIPQDEDNNYFTIYLNGDEVTDYSDEGFDFVSKDGVVSFTAISVGDDKIVSQASVGTYKIKLELNNFKLSDDDDKTVSDSDTIVFEIKNSQPDVKATQDEKVLSVDDVSDVEEVIKEALTFKFDGEKLGDIYSFEGRIGSDKDIVKETTVVEGNTVRIDSVTFKYDLDDGNSILLEADDLDFAIRITD